MSTLKSTLTPDSTAIRGQVLRTQAIYTGKEGKKGKTAKERRVEWPTQYRK